MRSERGANEENDRPQPKADPKSGRLSHPSSAGTDAHRARHGRLGRQRRPTILHVMLNHGGPALADPQSGYPGLGPTL